MKLLTASLLSVTLCAGAWAATPDNAKTNAPAEVKPAAKASAANEAQTTTKTETKDAAKADSAKSPKASDLKSLAQRAGYAFGLSIGMNIKSQQIDIDTASLRRGLMDGISGKTPSMTPEAIQQAMVELQQDVQKKHMERAQVQGGQNKTEGEAFLAQNKTKDGIVTTASGLQYKVLTAGKGEAPKASDIVTVHYVGKLLDGTEFDSSYKRNQPASFPVNGVIPGWTEALQLMKPGAKYRLFIPSNLAYGEQGAGDTIGPNAVLVFDVELLSVKHGDANQKPESNGPADEPNM